MVLDPAGALAASGPVASYSFDHVEGATVEDLSGNGHTATIEEGESAKGRYGSSLNFEKGTKCASIPDSPSLRLSKEFTLEAWVRIEGGPTEDPVIVKESEGKTSFGLGLGSRVEGMVEGFIGQGKKSKAAVASEEIGQYQWTYLATTYDGATLRVYLDGELAGTQSTTTLPATGAGPLKIGCDTPEGQFSGRIDEARIYNRTLSEKEIKADMATPLQTALDGPVATYSFDEGEGTTAEDLTGHGHTAAIEGAKWTGKGKYGGALEFDASEEDVLKIPDSSQLDFTEEFTLEAWVRPSGADNHHAPLIDKQSGGGVSYFLNEGGSVSDRPVGAADEEQEFVAAGEPIDAHAWTHVALTFNGGRTSLYIDGELVQDGAARPILTSEGELEVGGSSATGDYFDGRIDEVRLYDRALSEAEVQADKAAPIQTPQVGPIAEYSFDEGEGEQVTDISSHGHDATIEGAEWSEGKYGGSLKFSSEAEDMLTIPASEELNLTEEFTLEAWVKPEEESELGDLFVKENAAEDEAAYLITKHGTQIGAYLGEPEVKEWTYNESVRLGVWQHVAVTYDGARVRLYLNGQFAESAPVSKILSTDGPLRIANSRFEGPGEGFTGKVDQVRIYNRALDQEELKADKSPREGPVAAYTFNENEGTTATDTSGDDHTATTGGAEWTEGKYGRALRFNGEDLASVPASEELDLTDEFTLEAWVKPEAENKFGDLFVKENAARSKAAYVLADHHGRLGIGLGEPGVEYTSKEGSLPLNTWTYVTVTDSGYHVRLYVNGELVKTGTAPTILGTDGQLEIGGTHVSGAGSDFNGKIDEARIYDRALSEAQIEADMHNDFTPPEIELSGALTEGLKEGIAEYPLHIHAVDGKTGFPGVGVKSITISVDGEVVDQVEQGCEGGNCSLDRDWVFNTGTYGFKPHELNIVVGDQAGNVVGQPLPLGVPNGSIPACSPTGKEVPSTPDKVVALPGGGSDSIYYGAAGEEISFPSAPPKFDPKTATDEELALYGYPLRPPATEPALRKGWEETVGEAVASAEPPGCMGVPSPELATGPTSGSPTAYSEGFAIWEAYAPTPLNKYRAVFGSYHVPKLQHTCKSPSSALVSWVGLGGASPTGAFFQAGTNEPYGGPNKVSAFSEFFRGGELHSKFPGENPEFEDIGIKPGDGVYIGAIWLTELETAFMYVQDLRTNIKFSRQVTGHEMALYDGRRLQWVAAERPKLETGGRYDQQNFGSFGFQKAVGLISGTGFRPLGELGSLTKTEMQREAKGHRVGNLMVSLSPISKSGEGFQATWHNCHP